MLIEVDYLSEAMRPDPVESDYTITKIEGEIPRELNGTLYRNCPNQKISPKAGPGVLHMFDGDGFVSAWRFEDGKARYRSRHPRTESFLREQEEGEYCLGGLNVGPDRALRNPPRQYQANTNAVYHAGRLWAMHETMPPFFMDPDTLESKGIWDYDGKMLGMASGAHPCIDVRTGQMFQCGYQPMAPFLQLYVVEADGKVSLAEAVDTPWAGKIHDIAITENYIIVPLGAVDISYENPDRNDPLGGLKALRARPDLNLRFGIRKREPGSPMQWFEVPDSHYILHVGNAFERDGKIIMDAPAWENPTAFVETIKHLREGKVDPDAAHCHPRVYEFDLATGTCKGTKVSDMFAELNRFDDRLMGYENRYGYASVGRPGEGIFRSVGKYDRSGGPMAIQDAVEGNFVGEPIFVPRSQDAAEDDGFVMALRHDGPNNRTGLDILDARGVDKEPLARLWLDHRVPFSPHGCWRPEGT